MGGESTIKADSKPHMAQWRVRHAYGADSLIKLVDSASWLRGNNQEQARIIRMMFSLGRQQNTLRALAAIRASDLRQASV